MKNEPTGSMYRDLRSLVNKAGEINAEHYRHLAQRSINERTNAYDVRDILRIEFDWDSWSTQTKAQRASDFECLRLTAQAHGMVWIDKVLAAAQSKGGRTKEGIRAGLRYLRYLDHKPTDAKLTRAVVTLKGKDVADRQNTHDLLGLLDS